MTFNDTSTLDGLIQECERITLLGSTGISGNTTLLKTFTSRLNQAVDKFFTIALTHDGTWQFDDSNSTDLLIATAAVVSGQRDYAIDTRFLTVGKLFASNSSGQWTELEDIDQHDKNSSLWLQTNSGTPTKFDLIGNSILLDPIPNYNIDPGLKMAFTRNGTRFVYTDTTKVPGIPSLFHAYLAREASLPYLFEHSLENAKNIAVLVAQDEANIREWLGSREKVKERRMAPAVQNNK